MQPDARRVRQRDPREGVAESLRAQHALEGLERLADSAPPGALVNVARDVGGPLIGEPFAMLGRVGIPRYALAILVHEPRVFRERALDAPRDLGRVGARRKADHGTRTGGLSRSRRITHSLSP
ncbi:MAG TPA: hypothetical protein VF287_03630, partial [Usitatibacter sp.]